MRTGGARRRPLLPNCLRETAASHAPIRDLCGTVCGERTDSDEDDAASCLPDGSCVKRQRYKCKKFVENPRCLLLLLAVANKEINARLAICIAPPRMLAVLFREERLFASIESFAPRLKYTPISGCKTVLKRTMV
jgi:hypothetical protein